MSATVSRIQSLNCAPREEAAEHVQILSLIPQDQLVQLDRFAITSSFRVTLLGDSESKNFGAILQRVGPGLLQVGPNFRGVSAHVYVVCTAKNDGPVVRNLALVI
jgi:hypothetical protein